MVIYVFGSTQLYWTFRTWSGFTPGRFTFIPLFVSIRKLLFYSLIQIPMVGLNNNRMLE